MGTLLLFAALLFGGYLISLKIHPLRKCPTCKMTGRHFGSIYKNNFRRCRTCEGTGRRDRWGTQVFFGGTKHTGIFPKK